MLKTVLHRALLILVVFSACLSVTWVVRAATNPPAASFHRLACFRHGLSSEPASASAAAAPDTNSDWPHYPAAYTAAIKVTGPLTPFHDNISHRYNYAFGKDSPFLPSNAMSYNGQFL